MRSMMALLLALTLCFGAAGYPLAPRVETRFAEADCVYLSDETVNTVQAGQLVCVLLPENPTTPYWWAFEVSDDTALEFISEQYQSDPNPEQRVGVGGKHAYYFRAARAGAYSVKMVLAYLGEDIENAAEVKTYEIVVENASGAGGEKGTPFP